MPLHRIVYVIINGVIMAGIRANTAWYACNEDICGSPVRSAMFSGVWQYAGRPWMATEGAVDRSASECRMSCVAMCDVVCACARAVRARSFHHDLNILMSPACLDRSGALSSLAQMASLPESGLGWRLY
jgi:hypothetical protein